MAAARVQSPAGGTGSLSSFDPAIRCRRTPLHPDRMQGAHRPRPQVVRPHRCMKVLYERRPYWAGALIARHRGADAVLYPTYSSRDLALRGPDENPLRKASSPERTRSPRLSFGLNFLLGGCCGSGGVHLISCAEGATLSRAQRSRLSDHDPAHPSVRRRRIAARSNPDIVAVVSAADAWGLSTKRGRMLALRRS